jgi:hypothetical protein
MPPLVQAGLICWLGVAPLSFAAFPPAWVLAFSSSG